MNFLLLQTVAENNVCVRRRPKNEWNEKWVFSDDNGVASHQKQ